MLAAIARNYRVPVAMVNQIGGNDSLVFDGSSLVIGPDGEVIAQAKSFEEDLICFDTESLTGDIRVRDEGVEASAYAALVLGTRDYVQKCGFQQVCAGFERWHRLRADCLHCGGCVGPENVLAWACRGRTRQPGASGRRG